MLCSSSYGITAVDSATSYVNLNGYTLHVAVEDGKCFNFSSIVAENGTISIEGGTFRVGGHNLVNSITNVATNVNFIVNSAMNISAPINVGGYEALYDGNVNTGTALLKVHGTFKPSAHDCFHGCEMQDGSTIDLSSRSNALPLVSAFTTGDNMLKFANGATVGVKFSKKFAIEKQAQKVQGKNLTVINDEGETTNADTTGNDNTGNGGSDNQGGNQGGGLGQN
jgi:hypothetical protein